MTYKEYLETDHWALISLKCRQKAGHVCEACGEKTCFRGWKLNAHHIRYRNDLFECTEDDLMALCTDCHESWHAWREETKNKGVSFSRNETRSRIRDIRFIKRKDAPKTAQPQKKRRKKWKQIKKNRKNNGNKQQYQQRKEWNSWPKAFTARIHY